MPSPPSGRPAVSSRRRGWFGRVGAAAVLVALALALPACGSSKSYSFPQVRIEATVNQDGSLSIVEHRTFAFEGHFSYAFFTVEHKTFDDVVDFRVSENGDPYVENDSQSPGTVQFEDNVLEGPGGFKFKATWWFDAQDEDRTFTFSYRVLCAADLYSDTAHLLWKFIGEGWSVPTDRAVVSVHLPGAADPVPFRPVGVCYPGFPLETPPGPIPTTPLSFTQVRAWGHGPLQGEVRIPNPQKVVLDVTDVAPGTFVEGSVLFPRAVVPSMPDVTEPGLDRILTEEANLANEANAERERQAAEARREAALRRVAWGVAIGLPFLCLLLVGVAKVRDRVPEVPRRLSEPPEPNLHPAQLAVEWARVHRKRPAPNAFRAQLLHLVRERVVDLRAEGFVTRATSFRVEVRQVPDEPIDQRFADFLTAQKGPVELTQSFRPTERQKVELRRWWKTVEGEARDDLSDVSLRFETAIPWLILLASLPFAIVMAVVSHLSAWFPVLFFVECLAAVILVRRLVPVRLRGKSRERMARWWAFRRYLVRFSSLPEAPAAAIVIWEQYLVWAVALDAGRRVEKQVRAVLPEMQMPPPWPGAPAGALSFNALGSLAAVSLPTSSFFTPTVSSGSSGSSSSSSSSSGFGGGGFSGGGGGGGGGTGGGAG